MHTVVQFPVTTHASIYNFQPSAFIFCRFLTPFASFFIVHAPRLKVKVGNKDQDPKKRSLLGNQLARVQQMVRKRDQRESVSSLSLDLVVPKIQQVAAAFFLFLTLFTLVPVFVCCTVDHHSAPKRWS
jgi:hypothetical protein